MSAAAAASGSSGSSSSSAPVSLRRLFLGVDSSTQSLKLTVLTEAGELVAHAAVAFDADCPEFRTQDGVIRGSYGFGPHPVSPGRTGLVITSPSLLFVSALEKALRKLVDARVPLERVEAVSVSGQQHGSVWWATGAADKLRALHNNESLVAQLKDCFALPYGPIWMDSSTHPECLALQEAMGGAQALADVTGSGAYERFTGNQIAKLIKELPSVYANTERISLVSSFLPSVLLGSYAPIDAADGAGMNMLDLRAPALPFEWNEACLAAVAGTDPAGPEELARKLGPVVDSAALLGTIHPYFQRAYGFSPRCEVVAGSGDNPCSLVGLQLRASGELGVSLGTSDTLFGVVRTGECKASGSYGHVFPNPADVLHTRMLMLCIKNGSLAREAVRKHMQCADWTQFNHKLSSTPVGNEGRFLFAWPECEIVPHTLRSGWFVVDKVGAEPRHLDQHDLAHLPAWAARAVLESQFLSMQLYSSKMGVARPQRLIVTGGASVNPAVVQILADVFGCDVETLAMQDATTGQRLGQISDTASLGAAMRARDSFVLRRAYELSAAAADADHVPAASSPVVSGSSPSSSSTRPCRVVSVPLATFNPDAHFRYLALLPSFEAAQLHAVRELNREHARPHSRNEAKPRSRPASPRPAHGYAPFDDIAQEK